MLILRVAFFSHFCLVYSFAIAVLHFLDYFIGRGIHIIWLVSAAAIIIHLLGTAFVIFLLRSLFLFCCHLCRLGIVHSLYPAYLWSLAAVICSLMV